MSSEESDLRRTLGRGMEKWIAAQLKEQRISYQANVNIARLEGENELETIYFNKEGDYDEGKAITTEYFIKPDMVICDNGVGRPRQELLALVGSQDQGSDSKVAVGGLGRVPHTNTRFSLIHNDIASTIYAVGSAAEFPSFVQKQRMRADDFGHNMNAAFYAAMNMLDKRVEFRYIPQTYLNINDTPIHFVGERGHKYTELIVDGDVESGRFLVWYIYGEEVVGFTTVGYQNLHLYLWEAMKLLIMPPATQLRNQSIDHRAIVAKVLKCRPEISAKRNDTAKIPSVIRAEFSREIEQLDEFRSALKGNIADENAR